MHVVVKMDIIKNYKSSDQIERAGNINNNFDSFWTLNDDVSRSSISTSSLSQDLEELKFIDDDEDENSSSASDEIYSLETSMIEMCQVSEEEDNNNNNNSSSTTTKYHHSPSPMVGRSVPFYANEAPNVAQQLLAQKQFTKALNSLSNVQNNITTTPFTFDSLRINKHLSDKSNLNKRLFGKEKVDDWELEFNSIDNGDSISLGSLDSDRSSTPVDMSRCNGDSSEEHPNNDSSQLLASRSKFGGGLGSVKLLGRPTILQFTDDDDIGTKMSPNGEEVVGIGECVEDEDEDDNSTICEGKLMRQEEDDLNNNGRRERDLLAELYSETFGSRRPSEVDRLSAQRLAKRLFDLNGFRMTDVAKHLSKRNDFSQLVGEEFSKFFDFRNEDLDVGLRRYVEKFILIGETQERERVIHHFSRRFHQCNPGKYVNEEACHNLVCALLLLNTDIHSNMSRKMTCDEFIMSMKELNGGHNFDSSELTKLFYVIVDHPFRWSFDNELVGLVQPKIEYPDISKQLVPPNFNLYLEIPSESTSKEYMSGYILRKCIKESQNRKTSIGKRGWKLYFGRLQDLTLHLYKDDLSGRKQRRSRSSSIKPQRRSSQDSNKSAGTGTSMDLMKSGINSYSDPSLNHIPDQKKDVNQKSKKFSKSFMSKRKSSLPSTVEGRAGAPGVVTQTTNGNHGQPNTNNNPLPSNGPQKVPSNGYQAPLSNGNHVPNCVGNGGSHNTPPPTPPPPPPPVPSLSTSQPIPNISDVQIYLNHAFASKAIDYNKKRNVFRLQLSNGSEYLFQVNEPREVDLWVDCLNFVAALLSPPVFHTSIIHAPPPPLPPHSTNQINGQSQMTNQMTRKMSNPTLTHLNIKEQLESHQRCVISLEQDLMHLTAAAVSTGPGGALNPIDASVPGASTIGDGADNSSSWLMKFGTRSKNRWQTSRQKKIVERELIRYKTYARLLEFELLHMHATAAQQFQLAAAAASVQQHHPLQLANPGGQSQIVYNQQTNQYFSYVPVFQQPTAGAPQPQQYYLTPTNPPPPPIPVSTSNHHHVIKESSEEHQPPPPNNNTTTNAPPTNSQAPLIIRPLVPYNQASRGGGGGAGYSRSQILANSRRNRRHHRAGNTAGGGATPLLLQYTPTLGLPPPPQQANQLASPTNQISPQLSSSTNQIAPQLSPANQIAPSPNLTNHLSGNVLPNQSSAQINQSAPPQIINDSNNNKTTFYEIL